AAVVFLLAVASVYQFLMGMLGVPAMLGELLQPLESTPWLFLFAVSLIVVLFGMVLEGLPAAVVLVPVVFPVAKKIGIHPIHFNIVLTAAVGIGLFLPPIGVGLLMALRFAEISVGRQLEVGVDVANDGEQPRAGFSTYVARRMRGFGGASQRRPSRDLRDFPDYAELLAHRRRDAARIVDAPQAVAEVRYEDLSEA